MSTNPEPGTPPTLGILGGSGIYDIDGLTDVRWQAVESPFGKPSDELMFGTLDGLPIVFLPRHGRGHRVPPSELNFRANIDALKRAGVTEIISLSAVGSLRERKTGYRVLDEDGGGKLRGGFDPNTTQEAGC